MLIDESADDRISMPISLTIEEVKYLKELVAAGDAVAQLLLLRQGAERY
jgi:hypothetical protein